MRYITSVIFYIRVCVHACRWYKCDTGEKKHKPISSIVHTAGCDAWSNECDVHVCMIMCVCVFANLVVGQVNRPTEDDPLHDLTAGRCSERASVAVITSQGW